MPITVLLTNTNWWPCSAHVAIALAGAGVRVAAVYPRRGHPLAKTSAVSQRFFYRPIRPMRSLAEAIEGSSADLVLPFDDRAVSHLHRLHSQAVTNGESGKRLAHLIERSLGAPAAFPVVSSRFALLRQARAEGIPVPEMFEVSSPEDLRRWSVTQEFPWVMKTDGSWGGLGVKVVRSLKEAEACFHRMDEPLGTLAMLKRLFINRDPFWVESWWRGLRPAIIAQSRIDGRPANCVVFCWRGKVLAGIAVEVVAAQGVMGPATIVRIVGERQMLSAAEALARRLNLSGFHGLDFMIENKTGTAYLVELNPRCAMPCHLRFGQGRDLIGRLCSELSGLPPNQARFVPDSDIVSYFPQAWLSDPTSEALRSGYHDVPWGEPDLLRELMLIPWPDRSFLARLSDRFRHMTLAERSARRCVFQSGPAPDGLGASANGEVCHGEVL